MRTFLTFIHQLLNSLIPHIQVILLVRTFLTLEGVVAPVDPSFNVYEAALPWAVQRALSPSNAQAKSALRATLLQDDNTPQWERLNALVAEQAAQQAAESAKAESAKDDSAREEKSSRSEVCAQTPISPICRTPPFPISQNSILSTPSPPLNTTFAPPNPPPTLP